MKHSDSNHSFKETLFGILFLCTIIGAVFAIYITSQTDIFLCLITFFGFLGAMFLLGGLKTISLPNIGNLVFVTLGAEFVISSVAVAMFWGGDSQHRTQMVRILPKLGCGGAVLLGAVMAAGGVILDKLRLKRCCCEVTAEVTNVDIRIDHRNDIAHRRNRYAPMVKYDWQGNEYETQVDVYQSAPRYNVGDKVTVKLNPDRPEEIVVPGRTFMVSAFVFGVLLMAAGITVYILLN